MAGAPPTTPTALTTTAAQVPRFGSSDPDALKAFYDRLHAMELKAAHNTAAHAEQRPLLAPRSRPFVERYDAADAEPMTWFHSRVVPDASLSAVFESVARRIRTFDAATGRIAVVLMRRYAAHTGLAITTHMMHRLFLAALVVASKAHHDHVVRTSYVAHVIGVEASEIHRLELAFCAGIDWRAQATAQELLLEVVTPDGEAALFGPLSFIDEDSCGGGGGAAGDSSFSVLEDEDKFVASREVPSALSSWTTDHQRQSA